MIDIALIRIDGGTQSRVSLNESVVAEYAEAYRSEAKFPPVTVFFDGVDRWLADGFHRYFAAKQSGMTEIFENIELGTKRDAILFSLKSNETHGLRRSNLDKHKAVATLLNDAEWALWSDREIARACLVGNHLVAKIRGELTIVTGLSPSDALEAAPVLERTFKNKHGTESVIKIQPTVSLEKAYAFVT